MLASVFYSNEMRWHVRRNKKHSYLFTKAKYPLNGKRCTFLLWFDVVECVRALAIDSKSLWDKSHSIKNRNTKFLVARKKTTWTNYIRNILLYFVAISTFITHFTFTSSEFHYSPANYNKKICYKQNEKHLQHSAAKKKIESFCQKKSEWKHRKEEEAKKKTSMQQKNYEIPSICTSFCMGMSCMHRREKRSSFCSLIDIFFKIDIILVRIYRTQPGWIALVRKE